MDETNTEYKKYEKNVKEYDLLIRSCTGVPLGLIESVTEGSAYEAWKKLLEKYETSEEDVQGLEEKWTNCKLVGITRDPTEWFLEMDRINRLFESIDVKYKKDEVQIAGHMLNNMCSNYGSVVTRIETSGKTKNVKAIQEAVDKHYKKKTPEKGKVNNPGEAFFLANGKKRFTGKCNYCGKPGHKAIDCFKKKAGERNGYGDARSQTSSRGKILKC